LPVRLLINYFYLGFVPLWGVPLCKSAPQYCHSSLQLSIWPTGNVDPLRLWAHRLRSWWRSWWLRHHSLKEHVHCLGFVEAASTVGPFQLVLIFYVVQIGTFQRFDVTGSTTFQPEGRLIVSQMFAGFNGKINPRGPARSLQSAQSRKHIRRACSIRNVHLWHFGMSPGETDHGLQPWRSNKLLATFEPTQPCLILL